MRAIAVLGVVASLSFAAVGCGSTKSDRAGAAGTQTSPQRQPPQIDQQAVARLRQCLKKHGVTLPTGGPQGGQQGQPPTLDDKTRNAMQACSQYLPAQPQGGFGG